MTEIAGAVMGMLVCLFGIWAFLKGQSSMLEIRSGGKPALVKPAGFFAGAGRAESGELETQVRELFRDPALKREE